MGHTLILIYLLKYRKLARVTCLILLSVGCLSCVSGKQDQNTSFIQTSLINTNEYTVHYAFAGDINKDGVIFIHGTPGSWSAFKGYLENTELKKQFFMVSVDRINWGLSSSQKEFNFDEQANAIRTIMQQFPSKKWLVVGHSLGGSIAPQLALNYSSSVKGLLLLSASLKPNLGNPRWYNHLANQFFLKWLVPTKLDKANEEIMSLRHELLLMNQQLNNTMLDLRAVVIQGMKDKLVSPQNASFVIEDWKDNVKELEVITLDDAGHFLPWRQTELVVEQIKQFSNVLSSTAD